MAAGLLQQPAEALDIVDGKVMRKGDRVGAVDHARRGRAARSSRRRGCAASATPGLSADGWFYTDHMNYPYGVHIAVVRVDRETGGVTVERYLVAYDVGRAVNPMLVEGQIAGGFAQGLGGALLEEFLYDDRGEPLSVNFADYLMPTAREVPPLDVADHRGRAEPAQSARPERRGRGRRQRGRRRDRLRHRRRHRHAGRGHAAAGDAAAPARDFEAHEVNGDSTSRRSAWARALASAESQSCRRRQAVARIAAERSLPQPMRRCHAYTDRKLRWAATSPARSDMRPCHCNWPFSST